MPSDRRPGDPSLSQVPVEAAAALAEGLTAAADQPEQNRQQASVVGAAEAVVSSSASDRALEPHCRACWPTYRSPSWSSTRRPARSPTPNTAAIELQRSLLPTLPEIPGVTAAAHYLSASTAADVGGDLYDLLHLPDDSVGIAIGEVVGRDVAAAAAMGHLRGLLRACACAWDAGEGDPGGDPRPGRPAGAGPARGPDGDDGLRAGRAPGPAGGSRGGCSWPTPGTHRCCCATSTTPAWTPTRPRSAGTPSTPTPTGGTTSRSSPSASPEAPRPPKWPFWWSTGGQSVPVSSGSSRAAWRP